MMISECAWCRKKCIESDESHVTPECFGNSIHQVIPRGVICRKCNNYFGSKIEPSLIKDPAIRALCVSLHIKDPGDGQSFRVNFFDPEHPSLKPVERTLSLNMKAGPDGIVVDVNYAIAGASAAPNTKRHYSAFSRAIHKIAFESFIHLQLLGQCGATPSYLAPCFDPVRIWARAGNSAGKVRPLYRLPSGNFSHECSTTVLSHGNKISVLLSLFGDFFLVSLTEKLADVESHLREVARERWNEYIRMDGDVQHFRFGV